MVVAGDRARQVLLRRGFALEYVTLAWNVAGIVVLAIAAVTARSVALAGFGLDSLIEIGASTVVIWELSGTGEQRQRRGLRLIGYAFAALAVYLLVQSTVVVREIFGTPGASQLREDGDLFSPAHSARCTARIAARNSLCWPNARRAARKPGGRRNAPRAATRARPRDTGCRRGQFP
jgi:hypothetical protein